MPTLLVNGFDGEVPFILESMTIDFTISRRWRLLIVSKAADISMPEILIAVSSFSAFAASHPCVHITFVVLRSGLSLFTFNGNTILSYLTYIIYFKNVYII